MRTLCEVCRERLIECTRTNRITYKYDDGRMWTVDTKARRMCSECADQDRQAERAILENQA